MSDSLTSLQCHRCQRQIIDDPSEAEKRHAEARELWGNYDPAKMVVVCDDCFSETWSQIDPLLALLTGLLHYFRNK